MLDVKVGSGAFMKTEADARLLAHELTRVGEALGQRVECLLTDMDQPLGMAVGNALEVVEAIETLGGDGPEALTELCLVFGARMLVLAEKADDEAEARAMLHQAISSGAALAKFAEWVEAQGGDPRVAHDLSLLPRSRVRRARSWRTPRGSSSDSMPRAWVARRCCLGAGRAHVDDVIDPGAGLLLAVRVGDRVEPGHAAVHDVRGFRRSARCW